MTKQLVEVITSVERRRRWSREEKVRPVAATLEPGTSVSEIVHSAGIHVSQRFRWRKGPCQISAPPVPQFVPVEVVEAPAISAEPPLVSRPRKKASIVTIELGNGCQSASKIHPILASNFCTPEHSNGRRLRVESDIDTEALARILDVLERR